MRRPASPPSQCATAEVCGSWATVLLGMQAAGTYESVTNFASAAARQSSKQIASLGEASWRYVSSQYSLWRSPQSPLAGMPILLSSVLGLHWGRTRVADTTSHMMHKMRPIVSRYLGDQHCLAF